MFITIYNLRLTEKFTFITQFYWFFSSHSTSNIFFLFIYLFFVRLNVRLMYIYKKKCQYNIYNKNVPKRIYKNITKVLKSTYI